MTETSQARPTELQNIRLTPEQKRFLSDYAWRRRSNISREIHRALSQMLATEGIDWDNPPQSTEPTADGQAS